MQTVALIDYGSGNLRSAEKALARVAAEAMTGHGIVVTADPAQVESAERIVLPGVGAFADCMRGVSSIPGMMDVLKDKVLKRRTPFLGICVGMQLLAEVGREHGDHKGFGWIPGEVVRISSRDASLKIPHMGWNALSLNATHPMLNDMSSADVYFVHSFYVVPDDSSIVATTTDYGESFVSSIATDTLFACQFHPEKSQELGLRILANFGRFVASN